MLLFQGKLFKPGQGIEQCPENNLRTDMGRHKQLDGKTINFFSTGRYIENCKPVFYVSERNLKETK